ncbi:hypothetical protein CBS470a_009905 [Colletotrichum nupharicola]|nr:hypothetical protein CBS470a_009905 [Colletotrichum nupharicola]
MPMIMQTLMKSGIPARPEFRVAITKGDAAEPDPPRRRGSSDGTMMPIKITQTKYMKLTRIGTRVDAWAIEYLGELASPPMTPMKTWSPTAQMARTSIFDRSGGPGASDQGKREEDNEDEKNDLDKRSNGLKPSEELVWEEEDDETDA